MTIESSSAQQTMGIGERLAALLGPGDVIALIGELGAGKTQLVRGIARGLNLDPSLVSSPTFVLVHVYEGDVSRRLVHVDAYRLTQQDDLEELGVDRYVDQRDILVIEWADRLGERAPPASIRIHLEHTGPGETSRLIRIESSSDRNLQFDG